MGICTKYGGMKEEVLITCYKVFTKKVVLNCIKRMKKSFPGMGCSKQED